MSITFSELPSIKNSTDPIIIKLRERWALEDQKEVEEARLRLKAAAKENELLMMERHRLEREAKELEEIKDAKIKKYEDKIWEKKESSTKI